MRIWSLVRRGLLVLLGWACVFIAARGPQRPQPAQPARTAAPAMPVGTESDYALAGRVIAVDAGHGGYDGGARARDSRIWEKEINLSVSLKLRDLLTREGAVVVLTRERDESLDSGGSATQTRKRQDMEARVAIVNQSQADCLISVHMNEYRSRAESGPQTFFRKGHAASEKLAAAVQTSLIQTLSPSRQRTHASGDFFILSLNIPSVLVECGFISNANEEKKLLDSAYQTHVAEAVRDGLIRYFADDESDEHASLN